MREDPSILLMSCSTLFSIGTVFMCSMFLHLMEEIVVHTCPVQSFLRSTCIVCLLVPHMTRRDEQESKLMQNPYMKKLLLL
jgi:hypothetical protein